MKKQVLFPACVSLCFLFSCAKNKGEDCTMATKNSEFITIDGRILEIGEGSKYFEVLVEVDGYLMSRYSFPRAGNNYAKLYVKYNNRNLPIKEKVRLKIERLSSDFYLILSAECTGPAIDTPENRPETKPGK